MLRNASVLALGLILLATATAEAEVFKPFTTRPLTQQEYATAIRNNDRSLLHTDCNALVRGANARNFQDELFLNCDELATYMETRSVVRCESASRKVRFSRIAPNGEVDSDKGVEREVHGGEQCLVDTNTGLVVASLFCGNYPIDLWYKQEVVGDGFDKDRFRDSLDRAGKEGDRLERERGDGGGGNIFTRNKGAWITTAAVLGVAAAACKAFTGSFFCSRTINIAQTQSQGGGPARVCQGRDGQVVTAGNAVVVQGSCD